MSDRKQKFTLIVRLDPEEYRMLYELAKRIGMNLSQYVRYLVYREYGVIDQRKGEEKNE